MSRTLKSIIPIPDKVKVEFQKTVVKVEGPKGKLELIVPPFINHKKEDSSLNILVENYDDKEQVMIGGTIRQLVNNMVLGVSAGYKKTLVFEGVGYRTSVQGSNVTLNVGYSNPVVFKLPQGVTASVENNTRLTLESIDKQQLGQVAADIRKVRPPEPYKGKGIRYENEVIRRKAGKTGKK